LVFAGHPFHFLICECAEGVKGYPWVFSAPQSAQKTQLFFIRITFLYRITASNLNLSGAINVKGKPR
jgi:hypothetical protein